MRNILIVIAIAALVTGGAIYAAAISGSAKRLAGSSDSVTRCFIRSWTNTITGTGAGSVTTVTPTVRCEAGGTFSVTAAVTSGTNVGTGTTQVTLTANTDQAVTITISPSVTISNWAYDVVFSIAKG